FSKVIEWSVWANLDDHKNSELLLLKGHLILELFMESILNANDNGSAENKTFHKKTMLISKLLDDKCHRDNITQALFDLNRIRNKFAHDWQFSLELTDVEEWANTVLSIMPVKKLSKYTYRTILVHAFVALANAIVECEKKL
ncbi:MAG: hypothetical protein WD037_00015, partial [Balneolales bacterium]